MVNKFLTMDGTLIKITDVVYRMLRMCSHYICKIINGFRGKKVPPIKDPILLLSATELAKRIREGTLSSVSVVQAYINRINEVEPYINATVDRRFKDALEEAKEADAFISSGKMTQEQLKNEKPLLGVPFTVKIMIKVKGFRCTAGSLLFKNHLVQEDSVTVALMKKAGTIVLASTNCAECGANIHSSNYVHGTTFNPYDTSKTSGGSSGGESAIIAAAGSVIGLGNDLGGSIRIPSNFTGIFGHKPSRGLISNVGGFPYTDPEWQHIFSTGPMCRYAEDLVTTMRILSASDLISKNVGKEVNCQKLKVYYLYSFGNNIPLIENVHPEIKDSVRKVVSHFQEKGCKTEEVSIPQFRYSTLIYIYSLLSSIKDVKKTITAGKIELNPLKELFKYFCFRSMFTVGYILLLNIKNFIYYPEVADFYKKLESKLDYQLNTLLDENSVLVLPTLPFLTPHYNESTLLFALSIGYTAIFNTFGLPVTQCPVGLSKQGLPIGIQIVGRQGNDPLTIACAIEVEKVFGGWRAP